MSSVTVSSSCQMSGTHLYILFRSIVIVSSVFTVITLIHTVQEHNIDENFQNLHLRHV